MNKKFDKKKILKISLVLLIFFGFVFMICNNTVLADVGNNNRYDSGGSDSDGSDIFFIIWLLFDLIDMLGLPGAFIVIVIVGVILLIVKKNNGNVNVSNVNQSFDDKLDKDTNNEVAEQIREIDPNFSSDKFIGWAREVFIKIQEAWTNRDWKVIRPFETEELFQVHNTQLNEYIKNNKINVVEKINIKKCILSDFNIDGDKEVLIVKLDAIMRDYVIDASSKKVLESDPNKDWHMSYEMVFNRKHGVKTERGLSNKSTTNCPNCGAPTEITSSGQCDYCKSVITTGEHDWVLSDIHSID